MYGSDATLATPTEMPCLLSPKLLRACMSTTKAIRKSSHRLQVSGPFSFRKEVAKSDTVVKILGHMYPLRAWCNA